VTCPLPVHVVVVWLVAGIVIDSIGTAANNYAWEYTLRVNNSDLTAGGNDGTACYPTSLPETNDINLRYEKLYHTIYMQNGFVWLQDWMDQYIRTQPSPPPSPSPASC
jgi:hypothetical protein